MKKKNSAPTIEQWKQLYEIAGEIKLQAPWNNLWDTYLFTVMLPKRKEPVFISVIGRNGECYGVGIYPGYDSLLRFYRLMDMPQEDLSLNPLGFQSCLMCYYGNRDELAPEERETIKSLGLKFRGENNWIYFRAMEEGYYPWFINSEQAVLITEALREFSSAYKHFTNDKIKVDFENGETLMHCYSAENGVWLDTAAPLPSIPEFTKELVFDNKSALLELQGKPTNKALIELDIQYLPMPVQDKPDEIPYFPPIAILINRRSGIIIDQKVLDKKKKKEDAAVEMLINYTVKYGKPYKLFVRDEYFLSYVKSLCSQLGITVLYGEGMESTNEFIKQLAERMG